MKLAPLLVSLALLGACKSTAGSELENGLPFRNLARGYQSGVPETGIRIVRDETAWRSLWNSHASFAMPVPDAPVVDFKRDMVVYVSIGSRPTYGYGVEIVRVVPVDDLHFRVEVVERKPAPDAITSQIVTRPYHMVVTARRAGEAQLVTR